MIENNPIPKSGVYMLTFPNGKKYVGVSCGKSRSSSIQQRWNDYKKNKCQTQTALFNALKKFGHQGIKFEVVFSGNYSPAEFLEVESKFIKEHRTQEDAFGYNILPGGRFGRLGIPQPQSFKDKMSARFLGKPLSQEHKEKLKKAYVKRILLGKSKGGAKKGSKLSEESRIKRAIAMSSYIVSNETREKLSKSHSGVPRSPETIKRIIEGKKKAREVRIIHRLIANILPSPNLDPMFDLPSVSEPVIILRSIPETILEPEPIPPFKSTFKPEPYLPPVPKPPSQPLSVTTGRTRVHKDYRKPLDVTGQRFGHLVALTPISLLYPRSRAWACKCDCGREVTILSGNLYGGRTKSCGCIRRAKRRR